MKNLRNLAVFALALVLFSSFSSAATYYYDYNPYGDCSQFSYSRSCDSYSYQPRSYSNNFPRSESSFGSSTHYEETPGFTQFPKEKTSASATSNIVNTNFDSSSTLYDYRGPMFERKAVYSEDLLIDKSSKSGFFHSKNKNILKHSITNTVTEKYVGASESLYVNNQNNRVSTANSNQAFNNDYDGGFSWGKARVYDHEEYQESSSRGYGNYYYRPYFDQDRDYYNWRY